MLMVAIAAACFILWQPTESSATYIGTDTLTRGTWTGVYGTDGQIIPNLVTNPPKYAKVDVTGATTFTWWAKTKDLRALQHAKGSSDRIASLFYPASNTTNSFSVTITLSDGKWHQIALYLCDWDSDQREESLLVSDPATSRLFDTRSYHNFQTGRWVVWKVKGSVNFQIRGLNGSHAAVNGIFFDRAVGNGFTKAATVDGAHTPASAKYLGADTATQGTWRGVYGADGQMIPNDVNDPPGYALVTLPDASMSTWTTVASDRRALQNANGSASRIASQYHPSASSKVLSIRIDFTDLKTHRIALYMCDWVNAGQVQSVSVFDAGASRLLDTRRYTALVNGKWSVWNISGSVLIEVRSENGVSPSLNGIFFQ